MRSDAFSPDILLPSPLLASHSHSLTPALRLVRTRQLRGSMHVYTCVYMRLVRTRQLRGSTTIITRIHTRRVLSCPTLLPRLTLTSPWFAPHSLILSYSSPRNLLTLYLATSLLLTSQ